MKESPRRYINPFLSDEENEKLNLWTEELDHLNTEHDKLTHSLGPSEFCEKETELYTDKNVMECELPELLIYYKEGTNHVKDICVDEGTAHGERILFDDNNNETLNPELSRFSKMEDYYVGSNLCSGTNVKSDTSLLVLEPSNDHLNIQNNHSEVTGKISDPNSWTEEVDADLPVSGPINDDNINMKLSTDTEFQDQDSQGLVPDCKDCGYKEEVIDADLPVSRPINDHKNIKLSTDTEIHDQDSQGLLPDYKENGCKEEVIDSVGPNVLKEISKDDSNDANGISKSAPDRFMFPESVTVLKASENDGPGIFKKEVIDSIGPNELKEIPKDDTNGGDGNSKSAPDRFMFSSESVTVSKATENDGPCISGQPGERKINSSKTLLDNVSREQVVSNSGPSLEQNRILPSLKSLLESIDQQPFQSPVGISKRPVESGNTVEGNNTLNLNDIKPTTSSEHVHNIKNLEHIDELSVETISAPKLQDMGSDEVATVIPVHRGGESSFSVAGPGVEHITYSGPIAFSGSTSLRSDSSATSTRSFAFPILQNEWNSSPVRMAKADRRHLQKHRGWRHGLLCCRF